MGKNKRAMVNLKKLKAILFVVSVFTFAYLINLILMGFLK